MESFFNAGHIVTNSPVERMEKKPVQVFSGKVAADFSEAIDGGSDYFILGFLEYKIQGERPVPVGINIKLYSTGSKKLIFEQNFPAGTGKSLDEEYKFAQNAGRVLISHIKEM